MKHQVVDPFVIAAPASAHRQPMRPDELAKPAVQSVAKPIARPKPVGISTLDGFVPYKPVKPANSVKKQFEISPPPVQKPVRTIESITPPRPLPQGPLHAHYLPKPAVPVQSAPALSPSPSTSLSSSALTRLDKLQLSATKPKPKSHVEPHPSQADANQMLPTREQLRGAIPESKRRRFAKLATWAVPGVVIIGGLSLFSQAFGEAALAVYAIVALWWRWPSQQTFALALTTFVGIIIASLVSSLHISLFDSLVDFADQIAKNLAVYAFLLLCIGTVALAREVRRDSSGH